MKSTLKLSPKANHSIETSAVFAEHTGGVSVVSVLKLCRTTTGGQKPRDCIFYKAST